MTAMTQDARIDDLETRLAWQDDLLDSLNETVAAQQKRIAELERHLELLGSRYRDLRETLEHLDPPEDAPPPHY